MYKSLKNLARQSFLYGIGSALMRITGFLLIPVYSRFISPADFGILAIFILLISILNILFGIGLHAAFLRFYYDCETVEERKRLAGTVVIFLLCFSAIFSLILIANEGWIVERIFGDAGFVYHFRLIVATVVTEILFLSLLEIYRAQDRPIAYISHSGQKFVLLLGLNILFIVYFKKGFLGVLEAGLVSASISLVFIFFSQLRSIKLSFESGVMKKMIFYGLPFVPANISSLILTSSDRYFLKIFTDYSDVGLYAMGYRFGLFLNVFLVVPFSLAWPTQIISILKTENPREIFAKVMTYFVLISVFASLFIVVFIREIYWALLTPEYYPSSSIVPYIIFSYVFQGIYSVGVLGMFITKKTRPQLVIFAAAAFLNIVLNLVLIPRWGITGAAVATLLAYAVIPVLTHIFSQRLYRVDYELTRIAKIFIAAIVVTALSRFGEGLSLANHSMYALTILTLFPVILFITGFFEKRELEKALSIIRQAAPGLNRADRRG